MEKCSESSRKTKHSKMILTLITITFLTWRIYVLRSHNRYLANLSNEAHSRKIENYAYGDRRNGISMRVNELTSMHKKS